jgi:primosomal protein N' (replication factor Y) (superfamily II helicase)
MVRLTLFADIIVPLGVPNRFTYRIPAELNEEALPGKRAIVQFGKTKFYTGVIYKVHEHPPKGYEAKYVDAILDDEPVVTELQLKFWDWLGFYYCAHPGDVMNAALPSGLKLSSTSHIQLNPEFNFEELTHSYFTDREHQLLDALHNASTLSFEDASAALGLKTAYPIINKLLKKNAVVVFEEIKDKYKPKYEKFIRLSDNYSSEKSLHELLNQLERKAFKQAEALLYFLHLIKTTEQKAGGWIKKTELLKKSDTSAVSGLIKKSVFDEQEFETGRLLFEKSSSVNKSLSELQEKSFKEVNDGFSMNKTVLLQGVTGSGKTEIYIQLIHEALNRNKQVLFLIPEIALTTQLITRLRAVFGELVGVYHSRFSENERVEIWNNVLNQKPEDEAGEKKYRIILGARSALFLPFNHLGLIIIDEEHDNSFKQHDPSPRYNARDSALYLASLHQAKVLLGSATPSIESYYNAKLNKYKLVKLDQQFVKGGGTDVEICDTLFYEQSNQMKTCLSPPLYESIATALKNKEQVILFQNRRGFAPYTECKQCGHVPHCIQCDVSLIYHKHNDKLICHYCGYTLSPPKTCAACGSAQLIFKGMGTEKIEEDVQVLFPEARVARMDLDSTRSKYAYKQLIDDFEAGNTDILIGTQMVTKGLDFCNVSVVGILNADTMLNFPDFRSFEKAWQLITQVRGRAGRNNKRGKVLIQTTQPKHFVIEKVPENNIDDFYSTVIQERENFFYPPFSRLIKLNVLSKEINEVNHLSHELLQYLKPSFENNILGPEFPLVSKVKNQYIKTLLIKTNRSHSPHQIRNLINEAIISLHTNYKKWNFKIQPDVDPV